MNAFNEEKLEKPNNQGKRLAATCNQSENTALRPIRLTDLFASYLVGANITNEDLNDIRVHIKINAPTFDKILSDEQKESVSERIKQQVIHGIPFHLMRNGLDIKQPLSSSSSSSDLEKTKQREAFKTLFGPYPEKISGELVFYVNDAGFSHSAAHTLEKLGFKVGQVHKTKSGICISGPQ